MTEILQPITLLKLLSEIGHERIRIPRLQRDYAQGRKGARETEVRERFLDDIRKALERPLDAGFSPLNLDFVYGCVETSPESHFSPLDGQQRLTTLFLLHWLLAWRDGDDSWKNFTDNFREGRTSKFSYHVRTTSTEFFNELVQHRPPSTIVDKKDLKGWIIDQPWYFRYWKLDPTVQGSLEMLQSMQEVFKGRPTGLYNRLIDPEKPAITFQLLDLGSFPLSDDLYIKMNARGKPLTMFETFKARYEQKLPFHFSDTEKRYINDTSFCMSEFVSRRMDTAWTDFFWEYHSKLGHFDSLRLDESFMNVFRMVALISRDPSKETYRKDIELLRDSKNPPAYSIFDSSDWLDSSFSSLLISLMEYWCSDRKLLPPDGPFNEQDICRQIIDNPADLSAPEVLLFYGYALFIHQNNGRFQPLQFAEWMRMVHNLAVNSDIDRNELLQNSASGLRKLLPDSLDILPRIANFETHGHIIGFSELPQREEALKASLILADNDGWRPIIKRAEMHGYFRGQIEFLLEFSGARAESVKTGGCAWDLNTHQLFQKEFLRYLEKAELMFDEKGLVDAGEFRWQRALLSFGDYLLLRGSTNYSFLENDASKPFSWKRLLRGKEDSMEAPRRPFLKSLWDKLPPDIPTPKTDNGIALANALDTIIESATGLEDWRAAFVNNANAIAYCCTIQCDDEYDNQVYLLSTTQRRGWHAELFTYILNSQLRRAEVLNSLSPFTVEDYHFSRWRDDEPHLPISFLWDETIHQIEIYGHDGNFDLMIKNTLQPQLLQIFVESDFSISPERHEYLLRTISRSELPSALHELGLYLKETS